MSNPPPQSDAEIDAILREYWELISAEDYDAADVKLLEITVLSWLTNQRLMAQEISIYRALLPASIDDSPLLTDPRAHHRACAVLAESYFQEHLYGAAIPYLHYCLSTQDLRLDVEEHFKHEAVWKYYSMLAKSYRSVGALYEAERAAKTGIRLEWDSGNTGYPYSADESFRQYGIILGARGLFDAGLQAIEFGDEIDGVDISSYPEDPRQHYYRALSKVSLWAGDTHSALDQATRRTVFRGDRTRFDYMTIPSLVAIARALLAEDELTDAARVLQQWVPYNDQESGAYRYHLLCADLHLRYEDWDAARPHLELAFQTTAASSARLYEADRLNMLAKLEQGVGNFDAAVEAAERAYEQAWCDGISEDGQVCYAYRYGLEQAKTHLDAHGAPYPKLPPFDPANFEPMPELEMESYYALWRG